MHVELTFTNDSDMKIAEKRTIYIALDDAKGDNHMRRPLPHVDFTKLEPGKPMTFEERLLAPAFEPGIYSISLWIPSNDAALKFDPAHNFLLSDEGVPDTESGLNRIAKFHCNTIASKEVFQVSRLVTLATRADPFLAQLIDYLHVPLGALAVDGAHQLPFFLCTQTVVCRDLLARERSLFPPACVLFEQFKNGIS